jgi:hypothetical protein
MATFDLGRVTPLYKGDYSASASYELNDVVLYNGNLYWHVQATATVGILPTDTTVWKLAFADEGVRAEIRGYADNAQNSADSALESKSAAAQSASQASASASQAALSAQTAQTAETGAAASAQTASAKASEASASAQSAASSEQTATDKATLASQKATAASESASLATAKATAAATSETNAAASAQTAITKASEAAASATSAQEYNESAQQSAVNAQTSATNAAASEAAAKRYAEDSAAYLGAYPTDTASGSVASFSDGANVPVKSLVVNIDPVQSGIGDPSPTNVRPISGWTGMKVSRAGKNLFDKAKYQNLITDFEYSLEGYRCKAIQLVPNTTYAISITPLVAAENPVLLLNNVEKVNDRGFFDCRLGTHTQKAFTTDDTGCLYIGVSPSGTSNSNVNARLDAINLQIEQADAATDYEPYQGNTCTIDWETEAATVYSGKLDVTNGELVIDRAYKKYDGSADENWYTYASTGYRVPATDIAPSGSGICNLAPTVSSASSYGVMFSASANYIYFFKSVSEWGVETVSDLRTWLASNNVEVCYELATPITIQLNPHEVTALLGSNNIWADTGDSAVEYRADLTLYINKKIAEAISALS